MSGAFAELDGRAVAPEEVTALALTGYGHFTTLLVEDGRARGLDLHLERLRRDAVRLFGRPPADPARIRALLRRAGASSPRCVVRATVFAPGAGVAAPEAEHPLSVLVTTRDAPAADLDAAGRGRTGLRLGAVAFQRELPEVKHTGLLGALDQRRRARLGGFDDALFLGPAGQVLEGPTWNVGLCSPSGQVLWPTGPRLDGVTMALLERAAGGSRRGVVTWPALREDPGGWTAFVTSAVTGVRAVASVEGVALEADPGAVARLRRAHAASPADEV